MIPEGIADRLGKQIAAGICAAARTCRKQSPYLHVDSDVFFTDELGNRVRTKITGLWPKFTVTVLYNELLVAEYEQDADSALRRL